VYHWCITGASTVDLSSVCLSTHLWEDYQLAVKCTLTPMQHRVRQGDQLLIPISKSIYVRI